MINSGILSYIGIDASLSNGFDDYNKERVWEKFKNNQNEQFFSQQLLEKIEMMVKELKGELFDDVVWKLVDISIIYGYFLLDNSGGEWGWDSKIYGIISDEYEFTDPCKKILKVWMEEIGYSSLHPEIPK